MTLIREANAPIFDKHGKQAKEGDIVEIQLPNSEPEPGAIIMTLNSLAVAEKKDGYRTCWWPLPECLEIKEGVLDEELNPWLPLLNK